MKRCKICEAIIEDEEFIAVDVDLDGWGENEAYICSTCSEEVTNKVMSNISNTVLIDGKAVPPGIYTCVWAGNKEWRVIGTPSDIIPDENSSDMVAFMEALTLAIEGVLDQHADKSPKTQWGGLWVRTQ